MTRSGYYQPMHFYNELIPEILRDRSRLLALLITRCGVDRYASGRVITKRTGLEIEIRSGAIDYPVDITDRLRQEQLDSFIVVFADEDDLDAAADLLRQLRRELPSAVLTLMIDDTSIFLVPQKRLQQILNSVSDLHLVVTGFVGGRLPMRKVLDHLLLSWPH
ncbi:MAG: hypothetical protein WCT10_05130 [Patescibacteria group bacterium]|jgi:hypothetical protein